MFLALNEYKVSVISLMKYLFRNLKIIVIKIIIWLLAGFRQSMRHVKLFWKCIVNYSSSYAFFTCLDPLCKSLRVCWHVEGSWHSNRNIILCLSVDFTHLTRDMTKPFKNSVIIRIEVFFILTKKNINLFKRSRM